MTRYRMPDGTVIDTERAKRSWSEGREFDGSNMVSTATGSEFEHQTLYRSRKGRYYIEHTSDWQGSRSHVEWVSEREAARWLLSQDETLPDDLAHLEEEITE